MFKMTLRELFGLVLICAIALGWWLDHCRITALELATKREAALWQYRCKIVKNEVRDQFLVSWSGDETSVAAVDGHYSMRSTPTDYGFFDPSKPLNQQPEPFIDLGGFR